MDGRHFDALTRVLTEAGSRRGLLALLATLPIVGSLVALLDGDETAAKGRRKRRKKRHKHGKGRHKENRKGKRKKKRCVPDSTAQTCAGKGGLVQNNCKKTVDCGPCDCTPPCGACFVCNASTRTCAVDPNQAGDPCGQPGQVCQSDGACACDPTATSPTCPACTTCGQDGACQGCPNCCDSTCCADGEDCCGTECVDLDTDQDNCGACGNACGSGKTCQGGVCGVVCGSDFCPAATEMCVHGGCQLCHVTCPGGTCAGTALQMALNGGGTVHVCPGRYTGTFSFPANVHVIGAGQGTNDAVDTILDAQQSGCVVTVPADRTVALRQLRITGGQTTDVNGGAGVRHIGTQLTMTDCTVSHNQTTANFAGSARGAITNGALSQMELTRCTIHDNAVSNAAADAGGEGGGIYNANQLVLTDCVIRNNTAKTRGGGLYNNVGTSELTGCQVTENTLTNPAGTFAGGIDINVGSVTLTDSFVWDNTEPDCAGNVIGTGCGSEPPSG